MKTVYEGSLNNCIAYIQAEEKKDETLVFDIVGSEISDTLYYVKELDGWDTYQGSF